MAEHLAALLRNAGHVNHAAALALQMRGHAENGANGHDASAADAGDDNAKGLVRQHRPRRLRQIAHQGCGKAGGASTCGALHPRAMHGHKRGTKTVDAGKILVAGRLVNDTLAAELGLQRLHRHAV